MTYYEEKARRLGAIVDKKQIEYGDVFHECHKIMEVLYPEGVLPEQYPNLLAVVRVIDKLCRVSRGDQGDESAWNDIAGYSLLMSPDQHESFMRKDLLNHPNKDYNYE